MKVEHLSELEEVALLVVVGLRRDAYGVAVQRRLERDAGRRIALGVVYAALDRLERKGYVTSALEMPRRNEAAGVNGCLRQYLRGFVRGEDERTLIEAPLATV